MEIYKAFYQLQLVVVPPQMHATNLLKHNQIFNSFHSPFWADIKPLKGYHLQTVCCFGAPESRTPVLRSGIHSQKSKNQTKTEMMIPRSGLSCTTKLVLIFFVTSGFVALLCSWEVRYWKSISKVPQQATIPVTVPDLKSRTCHNRYHSNQTFKKVYTAHMWLNFCTGGSNTYRHNSAIFYGSNNWYPWQQ